MTSPRSFLFVSLIVVAACSSVRDDHEHIGIARSAIVKGIESDASQDATVLVQHYDALAKGGGAASACTGSLLAPRLVLTARHCVSTTDPSAACDSAGNPIAGGLVTGDHQPNKLYVFGGKDRPDFLAGTARPSKGEKILTTGAKTFCNNDIAMIITDTPVFGAKLTPIRLDSPPKKNEKVTVVGFGIADGLPNPPTRRQKTGVTILDVGPVDQLGPAEFRTGEGTCQGDSGGPAIAASGAVLGALSRGGNGTSGEGADSCIDGTNVFTSVIGHADFIRAAYAEVGQEPWLEGQPNPTLAKLGGKCTANADCQSNDCNVDQGSCTQDCASAECPSPFECSDLNGTSKNETRRACIAPPGVDPNNPTPAAPPEDSCSVSRVGEQRSSYANAVGFSFALAVFFLRGRRKNLVSLKV